MTDDKFDPLKMEEIVRKLIAEGRMPSFEEFGKAMIDVREKYKKATLKARQSDQPNSDFGKQ